MSGQEQGARRFCFVLHCHQPPGNLPEVFDEAYARCYAPLLEQIERFEPVKVALHFSGALLEHAATYRPEIVEQLARLSRRGQVELLGGGFYDPVLTALPERDAFGQLEMMSLLLAKHFSSRPRGAWIAERVWDPELPRLLVPAGLGFTFVDAANLQASLPEGEAPDGYWVTNRAGQLLALFGIDHQLRYDVPGEAPEDVVRTILGRPGDDLVVFADDGEKLGLWPGSHGWVYEQGWLERFLATLVEAGAQGRIETVLPSEHLESVPPRGRVHLPSGSYEELSRWALGVERGVRLSRLEAAIGGGPEDRALLRGGTWFDFLARRPEAARLYGRALAVSERVADTLAGAAAAQRGRPVPSAISDRLGSAQRALYRAQGADAYWRGLFGGLHLPFLRHDAHRALSHAEALLDRVEHGDEAWVAYEERDLDVDGELEVVLDNPALAVHVSPHQGGALIGLEDKVRQASLLDVLAHRPEPEHAEADEVPAYDPGPRWGFVDRVGPPGGGPVVDLRGARFSVTELSVDETDEVHALVGLRANVAAAGGLTVDKGYRLDLEGAHLGVRYTVRGPQARLVLETELSCALSTEARLRLGPDAEWICPEGAHTLRGELSIEDPSLGVRLTLDSSRPARLAVDRVRTLVRTPLGFETLHQGFGLALAFELDVDPDEGARLELGLDVAGIVR